MKTPLINFKVVRVKNEFDVFSMILLGKASLNFGFNYKNSEGSVCLLHVSFRRIATESSLYFNVAGAYVQLSVTRSGVLFL